MNPRGRLVLSLILSAAVLLSFASFLALKNKPSTSATVQTPEFSNTCDNNVAHSAEEYFVGWQAAFKQENDLSNSDFRSLITPTDVSLRTIGATCELAVNYTVKKDWLEVNLSDNLTLGVPPNLRPDSLPRESDPSLSGRAGVSTVRLKQNLAFKSEAEAVSYFLNQNNLSAMDIIIQPGFQTFWDQEQAMAKGLTFAAQGGEPYLSIRGTVDLSQNQCFNGELALISQEITNRPIPCRVY